MSNQKKILMIDDDINLVNVFKIVCEEKGYQFFEAHSAAEGLQKIKTVKPDIIILDVIMEDFVAGFRIVTELRSGEPEYADLAQIPILMLTSVTTMTNLDFSSRIGTALLPVDAFLEKPVKPAKLLQTMDELLSANGSK